MRNTLQAPTGTAHCTSITVEPTRGRCGRISILFALALGVAASGLRAQCTAFDVTADLVPTKAAVELNAAGSAGLHVGADCSQIVGVNAIADVPDGEELTFVMTTATTTTVLGTAPAFQSIAQFVTLSGASSKLPPSAYTLQDVTHIQVYRNPNGISAAKRPVIRPKPLVPILDATF